MRVRTYSDPASWHPDLLGSAEPTWGGPAWATAATVDSARNAAVPNAESFMEFPFQGWWLKSIDRVFRCRPQQLQPNKAAPAAMIETAPIKNASAAVTFSRCVRGLLGLFNRGIDPLARLHLVSAGFRRDDPSYVVTIFIADLATRQCATRKDPRDFGSRILGLCSRIGPRTQQRSDNALKTTLRDGLRSHGCGTTRNSRGTTGGRSGNHCRDDNSNHKA